MKILSKVLGKLCPKKRFVMNVLDLSESEKGLATRTVNNVFTSASLNKHTKSYRNIQKLTSFEFKKDSTDEVYPDANSEILNVQHLLVESRQKLKVCLDDIISRVETGNTEHIEALLKAHRRQSDLVTNYSETLDKLYEKEIKSLIVERERQSSESDKTKLLADVETLSGCVNIGLRSGDCDTEVLLHDNIFETLVERVSQDCPFLYDIVKSIFPTNNERKNKGAVHALSLCL